MEMMTIKAAADAATGAAVGINFGYYTTSGTNNVHYVQNQFGTNIDYWRVYKFTASIPASQTVGSVTYTQDEVFQGMGGSSTKFKMTGSVDTSTSRAKLYQGAADKAAPTAGQTTDLVFASDLTFSAKDSSIVGYLGVYIEGDGTNDGTNTAPSGAFSVSIAKQTA